MMAIVELTPPELLLAAHVGAMRRVASIKRKIKDTSHSPDNFWETDADGAASEMAVAKYLNVYWVPTVNTGKAADVGKFQVRSTNRPYGKLIIREKDKKNEKYILVIATAELFRIVGWIWSDDAKQDRFWKPADDTGMAAWWVPQSELKPMETING